MYYSSLLTHWAYLSTAITLTKPPDGRQAAEIAFQTIFPQLVVVPEFTTY